MSCEQLLQAPARPLLCHHGAHPLTVNQNKPCLPYLGSVILSYHRNNQEMVYISLGHIAKNETVLFKKKISVDSKSGVKIFYQILPSSGLQLCGELSIVHSCLTLLEHVLL